MTITMIEKTIEREVAFDAMGSFQVDERSGVPLWIQIRKRLVFLITSGKYVSIRISAPFISLICSIFTIKLLCGISK